MERIASEYNYLNPSRSSLYTIIANHLDITEGNELDDQRKLIYLIELYSILDSKIILLDPDGDTLNEYFKAHGLDAEKIKEQLYNILLDILIKINADIKQLLRMLPTEKGLDQQLASLYEAYKVETEKANEISKASYFSFFHSNSDNKARRFLAQLAVAMTAVHPVDGSSHRIKLGLLIYMLHSIANEYTIAALNNSKLYRLASAILNTEDVSNIHDKVQLESLSAFKACISNEEIKKQLEIFGEQHFKSENLLKQIYAPLGKIEDELTQLIRYFHTVTTTKWPITVLVSDITAWLIAPAGYGAGSFLGFMASRSATAAAPTMGTANLINYVGTACLGTSGGLLGFFAASSIAEYALMRLFAKVLEPMSMMVGKVVGVAIGVPIDLTYKSFRELVICSIKMYEKIEDPDLKKEIDIEFISSLLKLPEEFFSQKSKERIEALLGEGICSSSDASDALEESEPLSAQRAYG